MTAEEMSNEFDVLFMQHVGTYPSLNEYEKSIILTEAQELIVRATYSGGLGSFESDEATRESLNNLIGTIDVVPIEEADGKYLVKLESNQESKRDTWYILHEVVYFKGNDQLCLNSNVPIEVYPAKRDELNILLKNPFRGPNKRRVIRVDIADSEDESKQVILYSKYPIAKYQADVLYKPSPIILTTLQDNQYDTLSIDGLSNITDCKLSTALQRIIVEKAVELAIIRAASSKSSQ